MLRPFLLIGVGGSGGKTLRVVRDELSRRLEQTGWEGELPQAWQFLHVDVPTHADGNDPDLPPHLPPGDYRGLVKVGITYSNIDAALAGRGRTANADAMATWRPDPNKVNIPVHHGAGQYRTLGRVITLAGLEGVREAVVKARRGLTGADVVGHLQEATRRLGGEPGPTTPSPVVVVVSSIAGGSGAGAVIDVCDTVRALGDPWASEIVGILYAPDVFDDLKPEHRRGVRPNSLATLGELLSGFWNNDGPGEDTTNLLARAGIPLGAASRLGPRYPFLVGNRNQHVAYSTQNDIYRAMGRSIAAWVASGVLQDQLVAFTQGNWSATAQSVPDNLPLHPPGTETPFTALGSARVGLGRDRFREYASEYLARAAVDRVLRRHEELRAPDDDRIERVLVAEIARDSFGSFLASTGLNERGADANDIIDAFGSGGQADLANELANGLQSRIAGGIPSKGLPAAELKHRVGSEAGARWPDFHAKLQAKRYVRGQRWVGDVQKRLMDRVARSVATNGAPVTIGMLTMLRDELKHVESELLDEASRFRRWAQNGEQSIAQEIDKGGAVITATSPAVLSSIRRAVEAFVYRDEADIRDLVAEVIPDIISNLVEPLRDALQRGTEALRQDQAPQPDGQPSQLSTWPTGKLVPQRLNAAPNEFLLEPTADYPDILNGLIQRSVASDEPGGARREAVSQVVLGTEDVGAGPQVLISQTQSWTPRNTNLQSGILASSARASFDVDSQAVALLARGRTWTEREGTAIGTYVREGLRDYLDPEKAAPREHGQRLNAFQAKFIAALNASDPLVSISPGVLVQVHGVASASVVLSFTEIPLPADSPGREVVRRVLQGRGQWTDDIQQSFGDGEQSSIDIFAVFAAPYEPVVFDSLMEPIASEWGVRSTSADDRAEFWRWRRARSLTESLPLAPTIRRAMIRGWFTARLLKQLDLGQRSARIWVPDETGRSGAFWDFPNPLLTADAIQDTEYLPTVLESVLLAMVEVNTRESLDPIRPYTRLRDLGKSGRGGGYDTYSQPSVDLRAWIERGENPVATPDVRSTLEQRRKDAEDRFDRLRRNYTRHFEEIEDRTDVFDVSTSYDLRHEILAALADLRRAVSHVAPTGEDDF